MALGEQAPVDVAANGMGAFLTAAPPAPGVVLGVGDERVGREFHAVTHSQNVICGHKPRPDRASETRSIRQWRNTSSLSTGWRFTCGASVP